ncbi:MAG: Ig-like domain-containing protein [bacterium]|nr:Ig-like domain-containing protein [bacterium]
MKNKLTIFLATIEVVLITLGSAGAVTLTVKAPGSVIPNQPPFTATVETTAVTDLYSLQIEVEFDTSTLAIPTPFSSNILRGDLVSDAPNINVNADNSAGWARAIIRYSGLSGKSGVGGLLKINFNVREGHWCEKHTINIDSSYTDLSNSLAQSIPIDVIIPATYTVANNTGDMPAAPGNLIATTISSTQVKLTWQDLSNNETGFTVERRTASTSFAVVQTLPANTTSWNNSNLTPSATYYYRIQAFRSCNGGTNNSDYSNVATAVTSDSPPAAPSNLDVVRISSTQLRLSWQDNSGNESGFFIERKISEGSYTQITTVSTNVTTYDDTGLTPVTTYTYRVRAFNGAGNSGYSNEDTATTEEAPPNAPTNLSAQAVSSTQINLAWQDKSTDETGFKIERSPDGTTFTQIAAPSANSTSYTDQNLNKATTYYYRVRAYRGVYNSDYSNTTSATTLDTVPSNPGNLNATAISNSQIDLSWQDNSNNETGFSIERKTSGGNYTAIATVSTGVITYSDTGLPPVTTYTYRVKAFNLIGSSEYSNEITATTANAAPYTPTNLSAQVISSSQVNLSWQDNSNNETGFSIERKTSGGNYTAIATVSTGVTSYSDTGLLPITTYTYRVRAFNLIGFSGYSNETTAITANAAPYTPTNLSAQIIASNRVDLSWQDNSNNETGFSIERKTSGGNYTAIATVSTEVISYSDTGLFPITTYTYRVQAFNLIGSSGYSNEIPATTANAAPYTPTNLSAQVISSSQVNLSWQDNSNNEDGFKIERKTAAGSYVVIGTTGVNGITYNDSGVIPNTTYSYRVFAYNQVGNSDYSNTVSVGPPAAPTNLVIASISSLILTWRDNSDNEQGFKIERKEGSGSYTEIATTLANVATYTDTSYSLNTNLSYRVKAYNLLGNSACSNEVETGPPSVPTNLRVTGRSIAHIALSWLDTSNNETGFVIERKTQGGSYSEIVTVSTGVTTYADTGLPDNTTFFYRVKAYNLLGSLGYSNEVDTSTEKFLADVRVLEPNGGEKLSGIVWVKWTAASHYGEPLTIDIKYQVGDGTPYPLAANEINDGMFSWDTTRMAEGPNYRIIVVANNGTASVSDASDGAFMIDNIPHAPQITVTSPNGGENWSGNKHITWQLSDKDVGDSPVVTIEYSPNAGSSWLNIASGLRGVTSYLWNTLGVPEGNNYLIRITGNDGNTIGQDQSDGVFKVNNNNQAPQVTVLSPNGGERLSGTAEIRWLTTDGDGDSLNITIYYSTNSGTTWQPLAANEPNDGAYSWQTKGLPEATTYRVRVEADDRSALQPARDDSDRDFTVDNLYAPTVTLTFPNGGEQWSGTRTIQWTAVDTDGNITGITIKYRVNGVWYTIATNEANDGTYSWNTASVGDAANYLVRVTAIDADGLTGDDTSDAAFTIDNDAHTPTVTLTSPAAGDIWSGTQNIKWDGQDLDPGDILAMRINVSADSGTTWSLLANNEPNDGIYPWNTTTVADGRGYMIAVTISDGTSTASDTSGAFKIDNFPYSPVVRVLQPNGGKTWKGTQTITWQANDPDSDPLLIDIYYSLNRGLTWKVLSIGETNDGRFDWNTTGVSDGQSYLIKVRAQDDTRLAAEDVSDAVFTIDNPSAPKVTVTYPNGGEKLRGTQQIWWQASDEDGDSIAIDISYSSNGGVNWVVVVQGEVNDGIKEWNTTTVPDGNNYLVKVKAIDTTGLSGEDTSDAPFMIDNVPYAPVVTLRALNGSETQPLSGMITISWTATDTDGDKLTVDIAYSSDGGTTWKTIAAGVANTTSYYWDTTSLPDGNYQIRITADDGDTASGTGSVISAGFNINNPKPPQITLTAPNGGEIWSGIRDITWTATDPDGDTLSIDILISPDNGNNWSILAASEPNDGVFSRNLDFLADGSNFLVQVRATDGVYTVSDVSDAVFTIGHLVGPDGATLYEGSRVRAVFEAGDVSDELIILINNESEITTDWVSVNNINPVPGTVWEYAAYWKSTGQPFTGNFDSLVEIRMPYQDTNGDGIVDGTDVPVDELRIYRLNKNEAVWETIEDGGAEVIDKRNKEVKTGVIHFFIYCLAGSPPGTPQVTLLSPSMVDEYWWGNREIRWQAIDPDGAPLTIKIEYQVTTAVGEPNKWYSIAEGEPNDGLYVWNTWTVADGQNYIIRVSASDGALGGYAKSENIIIDNNPHTPRVRVVSPNGGEVLRDSGFPPAYSSIRWTAGDEDGDPLVFTLEYSVDNGYHWYKIVSGAQNIFTVEDNVYSYSWDTTTVADGQNYLVRVVASDPSPRSSWDASDRVFTIDNSENGPVVKILLPEGGESLKGTSYIKWEAWDSDGDVLTITIQYSIDGETWYTIAGNERNDGAYRWDTRAMADGDNYFIKVMASDGKQTGKDQLKRPIRIDNQPFAPVVELLSPNGREYWQGVQNIEWTASDVDGGTLTYTVSCSPDRGGHWYKISPLDITEEEPGRFSAPWDTKTVPDGVNYLIKVEATDEGGLIGQDQSNQTFMIDNNPAAPPHAPQIKITAPSGGETWAEAANITWRATDLDGDPLSIDILARRVGTTDWITIASGESNDGIFTWNTTRVSDGKYEIMARVTDGYATMESNPPYPQVNIDNLHPPVVTIITPQTGDQWTDQTGGFRKTINWVATDPDAGDQLTFDCYYRIADSDFWWEMPDAKGLSVQTTTMDIRTVEDGLSYQIKVVAKDGTGLVGEGLSGVFTIDNNPNGPVVELLSPDGGEYWSGSRLIRWIAEDGDGEKITIDLACSVDGGKNWHTIVTGLENDGVYNWDTKTVADGVKYLIQVTAKDESNQTATDRSMAVFKIDNFPNAPVVRVISPNGITNGVRDLPWKNTVTLQWHASDADNDELTITLLYSDNAGAGWHIIASGLENTGVYDWSTNDLPDGIHYRVKAVASDVNLGREDVSDATFEIDNRHAPEVTVLSPNGGEVIKGSYEIRWTATDVDTEDQITISLSYKGNGVSNWAPIPGGEKLANTTGRFVWDTTQLPGNGLDYLIKIVATDSSGLKGEDVSNKVFTIDVPDAPVVKLISPAGSETWAGLKQIEWKANDPDGERILINIAYTINDGIAWNNIISNLENTGRFLWDTNRVKDNPNCRLRVQASDGALIGEAVSPVLQINNPDAPVVELISPNGGEDWHGRQKIEWYVNDPDAADILLVTVEFSFNNGRHWYMLEETERSSGGGTFYWETTTVENGTNYLVRITAFDGSHRVSARSKSPFRIDNNWHKPTIKLLSPKGGEVYSGQEAILWKASDLDGDKLKINIYYGRISEATGTVDRWYPIVLGEANDGYYAWDTSSVPDGVRYKIKVVADDEDDNSEVGEDQSATAFTVDNDPHIPVIRLTSPKAGEAYGDAHKLSSRIQIEWELEDVDNRVDSFKIEYSYDGGRSWIIEKEAGADNSAFSPPPAVSGIYKYNWETKDLPDDDYLVRVTVNDGHLINNDRTGGSFAIDNRHTPTAILISPNGGENLRGEVAIRWQAGDIDPGDTVYITIAYSRNSGSTWLPLATGEDNDGEYLWDTTRVQEARTYLIRVSASDGILYSTDQSDEVFTVDNTLPNIVRISPADGTAINAAKPLPAKVDAFLTNGVSGIDEEHSQLIITRNGGDYLDQGSIDRSQPDHLIFTPANGFDDGIYEVTVTPVDYADLTGVTKTSTFTIDQTLPVITTLDISSPKHGDSIKPENREVIVKVVEQMEMDTASLTLNYKIYSGDQPPAGGTMTTLMTRSGKASLWTFKATLPLKDKGAANGEKVDYWITGKDRAGNPLKSSLSPSLLQEDGKATLFIDEEPPVSESITINGGDRAAKDRLVTVALNVSGTPSRMMISEYPNFAEARWEDYVSSLTRKLSMGDGDKTIYVRYMDAATNVSASDSAPIILDTVSPTVAIDAPADGAFLNQANISIKGTATDASGIAEVGIQINGGSWVKATGTTSWSYDWSPGQDGSYNLKVRAIDLAGNQKESETRKLHVDRTAPVPLSIAINSVAEYTNNREVSVGSTVEGDPSQIMLSEEPNFTGANWITYTSSVPFTLSSGDREKRVYARYRDAAGNKSDTLAASIILDTTGPDVQITTPAAGTTVGGEVVNITGGAQDNLSGVELVQVSLDGGSSWIGVSGTGSWTYQWNPVKEGTVGLQARGKDKAGNFGLSPTISIQVDKTGPVPVSMKINSDQEATNSREATVALNVTGNPAQVRLSESKDFSGASWRSYTAELAFQLSSGDGMKTVYAQIKDVVGNLSQPISDQILLDTAAPTGAGIKINAGAEITNSPRLNLTLKVEGATRMMISEDGLFDSEKWELFASSREWPLSNTADGLKPLRVKFRDEAGNETDPVSDWIELDQTPPDVEISSPQAGIKVAGDGVPIKVPVDGNERVNLFYRWDHEVKGWQNIAVLDSPPYAAWWNTSKLGNGEYQIKAEGWDKAGNVAVSTITLVVDHQNPDLESNKVVPGESQFMEFSSGVSLEIPAFSLPGSAAAITLSDSDGLRNLGVDLSAINAANQKAMEDVTLGIIPSSEECRLMLYDGGGNSLSIPFNQALDIALPYPDANQDGLVDGTNFPVSTLKVFRLESDRWEEVGSDQARGGLVWAGVNQTGVYTLMARRATPAKSLRDVKVYPNPFRPGKAVQGAVKFINLRNDNEIRIYALSGELIKVIGTDKLATLFYGGQVYYGATWNGTNESGDEVATGVYIYVIKGGGDKSGKLSVIR